MTPEAGGEAKVRKRPAPPGERAIASGKGVGTSGEVSCPRSNCRQLASGTYDVLSCQDGRMLVRCESGRPRCYACKTGYGCAFNNGGDMKDDFCAAPTSGQGRCEVCTTLAARSGRIWSCDAAGSRLVRCVGGCLETKACAEPCIFNNGGTNHDDHCGGAVSGGAIPSGCATLTRAQVEHLLRWAGFAEATLPEMVRIATCESQLYTCAVSTSSANPGQDWGLFQISVDNWLLAGERPEDLLDPWRNTARAKHVFDQQGFDAWVCHRM